jgi:hypothetical protein
VIASLVTWHGLSWGEALGLTIPQAAALLDGGRGERRASEDEIAWWCRRVARGSA